MNMKGGCGNWHSNRVCKACSSRGLIAVGAQTNSVWGRARPVWNPCTRARSYLATPLRLVPQCSRGGVVGVRQVIAGQWLFGSLTCDVFNANDVLFSTASLLHLCCISWDRYIAVTDPFNYERRMTRRRAALTLAGVWMASTGVSHIPIHLGLYTTASQRDKLATDTNECSFKVRPDCYLYLSRQHWRRLGVSFWKDWVEIFFCRPPKMRDFGGTAGDSLSLESKCWLIIIIY